MKIVTVAEMRALERQAAERGISSAALMERAGVAVAREVRRSQHGVAGRNIAVLVGPGNNGGDGLVAARCLADWGARVSVHLLAPRSLDDANYAAVLQRDMQTAEAGDQEFMAFLKESLARADIVLDAVLGTGRSRPLEGVFQAVLAAVGQAKAERPGLQLVALDLPSGLDADSGAVDPLCPSATETITLGFPKHGLFRFPGAARVGRLTVVDIGIPPELAEGISVELITASLVAGVLPPRPLHANKGSFGRVLVVAGSGNYIGAAMLACRGAQRAGAGLVTLAAPRTLVNTVAGSLAEATFLPLSETSTGAIAQGAVQELEEQLQRYDVLLMGCGLGQHPETQAFVADLLLGGLPVPSRVLLDADALNALAGIPSWWGRLGREVVLTPHPGEMARLLGSTVAQVQEERLALARKAAGEWGQVVILKGAFTVVAAPSGAARVSPFANPALASAGTGDVLAGITAGLMAQSPGATYDAATAGVFLHGLAGERFVRERGDAGLVASDLLAVLPEMLREVKQAGASHVAFRDNREML